LGILSLQEHGLDEIPSQIYDLPELNKLRTIDLSKNKIRLVDDRISCLAELKSLNLDDNNLHAGSISPHLAKLAKLQNLSLANNRLGSISSAPTVPEPGTPSSKLPAAFQQLTVAAGMAAQASATSKKASCQQQQKQHSPTSVLPPALPPSLKSINIANNNLMQVPKSIYAAPSPSMLLTKLEKIDLSSNQLADVPAELSNLTNLKDLNLDGNLLTSLPVELGQLRHLKVLSLRDNQLAVSNTVFNDTTNIQPIPSPIFTGTLLIDLNLHGNQMTNTQLNQFDGFQVFLDRRQKVKSKTLTNLDVCGLK